MTALHPHRTAYARQDAPSRTPRGVEYDALAQMTQRLSAADKTREDDFPAFVAAVSDNLRLWSALATDVADPQNGLPAPLRAQLFYLYEFTAQHSRKLIQQKADIAVLVEINTSVMRGLRGEARA